MKYLIERQINTNLHFLRSERYLANMFLIHFHDNISTYKHGKPKTCCGGLGFKIIPEQ